jgi:hypothetical protein
MNAKWAAGNRVVDLITNEAGTIAEPPPSESEPSEYCIFVEWEDGERTWVNKDEVRRL